MPIHHKLSLVAFILIIVAASSIVSVFAAPTLQNQEATLTPMQLEIEKQRERLSSAEVEERRDALVQLRALHHPQASRVAQGSLGDPSPIVRATAAGSVIWLPADEGAASLITLLSDKDEFVRQQTAYALGQIRSRVGVAPLIERLSDKKDSVRGAAAVALGEIADPSAVTALAALLVPAPTATAAKKSKQAKPERNAFVLRAAARSLGQIGDRAAVPALSSALQDENAENDVRREAAWALGNIGDASAISLLQTVTTADDPYLADIAIRAVKRILKAQANGSRY